MSQDNAEDLDTEQEAAQGTDPGRKPQNFGSNLGRVLRRFSPWRGLLALALALGAVGVVLTLLGPRLLGEATNLVFEGVMSQGLPAGADKDEIVEQLRAQGETTQADMLANMPLVPGAGIDFAALGQILIWTLLLYVASSIFQWAMAYLVNIAVQRMIERLRRDIERKVHRLPLGYYDKARRGDLLSRVTNDLDNLAQVLSQSVGQAVTNLLTIVGVIVMMLTISWQLTLVTLTTIPMIALIAGTVTKRSQKQFARQWRHTGALNTRVEETFTGHALVRVYGRGEEAARAFEEENEAVYRAGFSAQFLSGVIMPASMFVGNLVYVGIAVIGGLMVAGGTIRIGDVQAFIQYTRQFTMPLSQLGGMVAQLQSGVASAERVFEVLDAEEESTDPPGEAVPEADSVPEIRFEHVAFRYEPQTPLISDMNLVVPPGSTVAIVGPTGAGKTTLVNLLMRFYDVTAGRITFDGVDIASLPRAEVRRRTGMVLQDTWLFGGTVAENIAYGRKEASDAEVRAAAEATYVDRIVSSLPNGYDTVIDEDGTTLSAGEKQLLTIARAFIADPQVLILDEATSSVDTRTELLVQAAMRSLRHGRTSFVIAHRLSTIRDADVIVVMEHGDIVEQGDHDTLLAADGPYARLYRAQFRGDAT